MGWLEIVLVKGFLFVEPMFTAKSPPDVMIWLTEKDPDAGKDWRRNEKRAAKDEMSK